MAEALPRHFSGSTYNRLFSHATYGRRVFVSDCTLRDGEQQPSVVFDKADRVGIALALDELGVYEIEAGVPASSHEDREAIRELCAMDLRAKISVLCRAREDDIDEAKSLGVWGVRLSFPISPVQRKHKLKGISDAEYLARSLSITGYARDKGLHVIFSPYDTTRAKLGFLLRVAEELAEAGTVDRLRVVDTTGCATPQTVSYIVAGIHGAAPKLPLEIHCHNDFGLGCANTIAGVLAGADFISTTINGIGERGGNAATEEVCLALELLYGIETRFSLEGIAEISRLVVEKSRVPLQPHKPIVGQNAFAHEAGMVVAGVLSDPTTAEPYPPALVGQQRKIIVGKKSGLATIAWKIKELNLDVPEARFASILKRVKEVAIQEHRSLTDHEFKSLSESE